MTADEVKTLVQNIVSDLNAVSDLAAGVDPALVPFIAIGKSVDTLLPGLASTVTKWLQGNAPTDQEQADLLAQLSVLGDPKNP